LSTNLGASNSWNPKGLSRDCNGIALTLPLSNKDDKMGWTCSMHGRAEKYRIFVENLDETANFEDLDLDGG
jgi:hypothetical protein